MGERVSVDSAFCLADSFVAPFTRGQRSREISAPPRNVVAIAAAVLQRRAASDIERDVLGRRGRGRRDPPVNDAARAADPRVYTSRGPAPSCWAFGLRSALGGACRAS